MPRSKIVGILGGMGPYASHAFYQAVLDLTPIDKDWDHLRIIMDSNPHIPSRSRHHLYGESSPVPAMIESCRKLEAYPVDFIVIPCNSASYFLPEIQAAVQVPVLNIMQIAAAALAAQWPQVRRVSVLGGVITYDHCTYEPYLRAHGLTYVHHSPQVQRKVEKLIEGIKLNANRELALGEFKNLITSIHGQYKVEAVILGCTEFGCLGECRAVIPLVDSSRELARATVQLALEAAKTKPSL